MTRRERQGRSSHQQQALHSGPQTKAKEMPTRTKRAASLASNSSAPQSSFTFPLHEVHDIPVTSTSRVFSLPPPPSPPALLVLTVRRCWHLYPRLDTPLAMSSGASCSVSYFTSACSHQNTAIALALPARVRVRRAVEGLTRYMKEPHARIRHAPHDKRATRRSTTSSRKKMHYRRPPC